MIDLVLRLVGAGLLALLFSQSAEFTQQYLQRLGGAADALRAVVERFDASAAAEGLSRERAVEALARAGDPFVARQGRDATETIAAFTDTERRYRDLLATAPLLRPFEALADVDRRLVARTAADFRPALPIAPDGLVLTLFGFLGGWALGAGAAGTRRIVRRRRKRRIELA